MKLIEPTEEYVNQIRAYREEFIKFGSSTDGTGTLSKCEDPQEWIDYSYKCKSPDTVPQDHPEERRYLRVDSI